MPPHRMGLKHLVNDLRGLWRKLVTTTWRWSRQSTSGSSCCFVLLGVGIGTGIGFGDIDDGKVKVRDGSAEEVNDDGDDGVGLRF